MEAQDARCSLLYRASKYRNEPKSDKAGHKTIKGVYPDKKNVSIENIQTENTQEKRFSILDRLKDYRVFVVMIITQN
ncbi:hypothetical protein F8M41_009071 [Gigaspora margarita]|uniref:Uncharacterized protein n=1 Tax=Gigaspora margarita TaxID=4874 RepID=A0A8H4AVG7_GIGMA|nr:hypothetical protein F8M41_009071 [Gigaspora margarita]